MHHIRTGGQNVANCGIPHTYFWDSLGYTYTVFHACAWAHKHMCMHTHNTHTYTSAILKNFHSPKHTTLPPQYRHLSLPGHLDTLFSFMPGATRIQPLGLPSENLCVTSSTIPQLVQVFSCFVLLPLSTPFPSWLTTSWRIPGPLKYLNDSSQILYCETHKAKCWTCSRYSRSLGVIILKPIY